MATEISIPSSGTSIGAVILVIAWLGGLVIVKGFWLMAVAIVFPPYAWYLFVEKLMEYWGLLGTL